MPPPCPFQVLQEFIQTYKHCVPPDLKRRLFLYLDYNQQYNHELNVMEEMLSGMPKQVCGAWACVANRSKDRGMSGGRGV